MSSTLTAQMQEERVNGFLTAGDFRVCLMWR